MVTIWQRGGAALAAIVALSGCGAAADLVEAEPTSPSPTSEPTSPSPTSPSPTKPTPTTPAVAEPKVGECRRTDGFLTALGADTDARAPVGCKQTHNAQTYHVGLMNERMQAAAESGNAIELRRELSGICGRQLPEWLGGSGEDVAISVFDFIVSAPSPDQVGPGTRWFSCDVFATRVVNDLKLIALPPNTKGLLNTNRADNWSRCNRGGFQGGTTNIVVCTRPHSYRAVGGIHLGDANARYPGANNLDSTLRDACVGSVRSYLDTAGGFDYAWTWPSRDQWNSGTRWGLCYYKTNS